MAENSWPYVDVATSDVEWSRLAREWQDSGIAGSIGGQDLRASVAGTGLAVNITAGMALLRGYAYRNDAIKTITLETASASARVDRVVLRLNTAATPATNRVLLVAKSGTPGSTTPPALTQTDTGIFEIPICRVPVGAGATSLTNVNDERQYTSGYIGRWTTSARPVATRKYEMGVNDTTGLFEYWNGTVWRNAGELFRIPDVQNTDGRSFLDGGKLHRSASDPTAAQGADGDVWLRYI